MFVAFNVSLAAACERNDGAVEFPALNFRDLAFDGAVANIVEFDEARSGVLPHVHGLLRGGACVCSIRSAPRIGLRCRGCGVFFAIVERAQAEAAQRGLEQAAQRANAIDARQRLECDDEGGAVAAHQSPFRSKNLHASACLGTAGPTFPVSRRYSAQACWILAVLLISPLCRSMICR